jgi:uncharacterized membrane protein
MSGMEQFGCLALVVLPVMLTLTAAALILASRAASGLTALKEEVQHLRRQIYDLQNGSTPPTAAEPTAATTTATATNEAAGPITFDSAAARESPEPPLWMDGAEPDTLSLSEDQHQEPTPAPTPPLWTAAAREKSDSADDAPGPADVPPFTAPEVAVPWWSRIDWENFVGVKLFSWIAGIALALAAVFFFRYTIEHGWITPSIRMAIGLALGSSLVVLAELRIAQRYRITANAFDGAGIAILYATLFSAFHLWQLLSAGVVLAGMVVVTAVAVWASIRRDSLYIALLGLAGGFATPALISSGADRPISLFSYLLILNAGLALIAWRKNWPLLTALSVVFTAGYQWAWTVKFLDESRLPLGATIFLLFPMLGVFATIAASRSRGEEHSRPFERSSLAAMSMPILFALWVASNPALGQSFNVLFGMMLCLAIGLAAVAALRRGSGFVHAIGALATVLVFITWFSQSYQSAAWPALPFWASAFILVYWWAPAITTRLGFPLGDAARPAALAGSLLLFVFATLAWIEPAAADPFFLFSFVFGLLIVGAFAAATEARSGIYGIAAAMAIITVAVWSHRFLAPETLVAMIVVDLLLATILIAAPIFLRSWSGGRLEDDRLHSTLLASVVLLLFFFGRAAIAGPLSLGPMLLLLLIITTVLFVNASKNRSLTTLTILTSLVGWIVLATWWSGVNPAAERLVTLPIILFSSTLALGAAWLLRREGDSPDAPPFHLWIAPLVGYAFLLPIAGDSRLAGETLIIAGTILALAVVFSFAAIIASAATIQIISLSAAHLVTLVWLMSGAVAPSTILGLTALLSLTALATPAAARLMGRSGETISRLGRAAVVSLFLTQGVTFFSSFYLPTIEFAAYLAMAAASVIVLLILADRRRSSSIELLSVAASFIVVAGFEATSPHWVEMMALASAVYLIFLLNALRIGAGKLDRRTPFFAAGMANLPFFLIAWPTLSSAGFDHLIGLLPLSQALLTGLVILRLVRLEPAAARDQGRLAFVAAAALALITVAIPLQLEKEWITVGWALEVAALAWLYLRVPHRGLIVATAALASVVFARLTLNPALVEYHPRSATPIINWYLYTYTVTAAAFFAAAQLLRQLPRISDLLRAGATILLFVLLNIQIADFYSTGTTLTFRFTATLAQDLTYTIGWALFAIALLIAGIATRSRAARVASIGLLVVTIGKCFLHDLARLGGLYRVGSFVGLAICLGIVAILLQRFVLTAAARPQEKSTTPGLA